MSNKNFPTLAKKYIKIIFFQSETTPFYCYICRLFLLRQNLIFYISFLFFFFSRQNSRPEFSKSEAQSPEIDLRRCTEIRGRAWTWSTDPCTAVTLGTFGLSTSLRLSFATRKLCSSSSLC